jgi:hypothetical protein
MGLDTHAINFLRFASKQKPFGKVATMGRQGLHVGPGTLKTPLAFDLERDYGKFCEQLLIDHFGASKVESFDYSEGSTYIPI